MFDFFFRFLSNREVFEIMSQPSPTLRAVSRSSGATLNLLVCV